MYERTRRVVLRKVDRQEGEGGWENKRDRNEGVISQLSKSAKRFKCFKKKKGLGGQQIIGKFSEE
jgi:hypothetical protein